MTILSRRIALALAAAVVAVAATRLEAEAMQVPDDMRAAIEAVIADEDAAWNRGDATGFARHATDDVIFTNVVGMFTVGRGPFTRQSARIFAGRYRGSHLVQTVEHIRFVRPDVAIVNTMFAVTGYASLPPGARSDDGVLRTRSEQVMTFDDGRWHVASFHNVPVDLAAIAAAGPP